MYTLVADLTRAHRARDVYCEMGLRQNDTESQTFYIKLLTTPAWTLSPVCACPQPTVEMVN